MKRFRFRLERVLRARQLAERERKRELAEAIAQAKRVRKAMDESNAQRQEAEAQITGLRAASSRAGVKASLESVLRAVRRRATRDAMSYTAALADVERARDEMINARREAETLEKLKGRRRAEWEAEMTRLDQKTNDELAARMAGERGDR